MAWALPRFWVSIRSYKKREVEDMEAEVIAAEVEVSVEAVINESCRPSLHSSLAFIDLGYLPFNFLCQRYQL